MEKVLYEVKEEPEKLILVGVCTGDEEETYESLEELAELVATAGGITLAKVVQNREKIHSVTYVGKGKIEEIKEAVVNMGATGVVCDDELSPVQIKNLEDELDVKIMDRTLVILDIFAKRAMSREGKIQVELAQLRYRSSRLVGLRSSLSRLGGGIGTRGPGEKKLEIDRRLINDRIASLRKEVNDMEAHREFSRSQRSKNPVFTAAIVGYTNAGKSTLLNTLTDAKVLEEDKLFATLDPVTRSYKLPSGQEVLFTDTVGFIRKLPHNLIDAFKSTLEEAKYADMIIHVVDSSNPHLSSHMDIVYKTLQDLEVGDKPVVTFFNKQDKLTEGKGSLKDAKADYVINGSIKNGIGIKELENAVEDIINKQNVYLEKIFDYSEAGKIQLIRKYGQLLSEEYVAEGILVKAYVPNEIYAKVK